jgi:uncharacterized protein (TIRG00374 family)
LKVGISGALLVWLITQIDLTRTLTVLAHARKAGYLVALALFIVSVPIRAYRWKILAEGLGLDVPIKKLTEFYFVGTFFNGVLPTGFGGDAIRAADLAHHTGRAGESLGTVLIDRFLGIIVLLAIGVGTLAFAGRPFERRLAWSLTIVLAIAVVGFWLLRRRKLLTRLARVVPPAPRRLLESPVRALYTGLQGYPSGVLVRASLVSLVFNALWIGVNVLLGWSLGIDASIYHYLLFVPVVSLSLVIPSVGGLGVRELTYVGLFSLIGVARGTAFALGIMVYAVTVATGLIGGLILLANASREYLPLRDH